jgi:hypothetical protein
MKSKIESKFFSEILIFVFSMDKKTKIQDNFFPKKNQKMSTNKFILLLQEKDHDFDDQNKTIPNIIHLDNNDEEEPNQKEENEKVNLVIFSNHQDESKQVEENEADEEKSNIKNNFDVSLHLSKVDFFDYEQQQDENKRIKISYFVRQGHFSDGFSLLKGEEIIFDRQNSLVLEKQIRSRLNMLIFEIESKMRILFHQEESKRQKQESLIHDFLQDESNHVFVFSENSSSSSLFSHQEKQNFISSVLKEIRNFHQKEEKMNFDRRRQRE